MNTAVFLGYQGSVGIYCKCFCFLTQVYIIPDTLWVEITVESETTMALVEQLAALPFPSNRLDESISQVICFSIHTFQPK